MSLNSQNNTHFNNPFLFQLLISTFNSLPELIYIMKFENNRFLYQYANEAGQAVVGTDSVMGRSLEELLPAERLKFISHFYNRSATLNKHVTLEE